MAAQTGFVTGAATGIGKALIEKRMKVNYVIGPGVWVLPAMRRALPDSLRERIFARMFER